MACSSGVFAVRDFVEPLFVEATHRGLAENAHGGKRCSVIFEEEIFFFFVAAAGGMMSYV